ncbi:MAG TPA: hypothetical protein VEK56_15210 [Vicinamibacterales bacterium]|nr:hypothetical protein [Vicinamibacterales bacterium]
MRSRAPRLPLRAPIQFVTPRGAAWAEGWTINVSRSGVLFQPVDEATKFSGDLEFIIQLSRGALHGPGVALLPNLHCSGYLVRSTEGPDGKPQYAAVIRRQQVEKP